MNTPREIEFEIQFTSSDGTPVPPVRGVGFLITFSQMSNGQETIPCALLEDPKSGKIFAAPAEACRFRIPTSHLLENLKNRAGKPSGILVPGVPSSVGPLSGPSE